MHRQEYYRRLAPAAGKAVRALEAAGIVRPLDERKRNRTLMFDDYLAPLRQGTELIP
jgi:hypothetical protein